MVRIVYCIFIIILKNQPTKLVLVTYRDQKKKIFVEINEFSLYEKTGKKQGYYFVWLRYI